MTLAACGGGGSSAGSSTQPAAAKTTPQASGQTKTNPDDSYKGLHKASRQTTAVITRWANTLRAGHVRAAAKYFDLPVVVQNAGPVMHLTTKKQVLEFNRTLPCGAHVVKTVAGVHYTVATFVLTERPGSEGCGATGKLAATAFLLRHGKISEWRRVLVPPLDAGGDQQGGEDQAPGPSA